MASWEEQKASYEQQRQVLDSQYWTNKVNEKFDRLTTLTKMYIEQGGMSQGRADNPVYAEMEQIQKWFREGETAYKRLLWNVTEMVNGLTKNADLEGKLRTVGSLKQDIAKLEKELQDAKQDESVAESRQANVEKPREEITWYQGFSRTLAFTRPLKQISIPILIGMGILFTLFSGFLLKEFFMGETMDSNLVESSEGAFSLFKDSRFYAALSGVTFVAVLLGTLGAAGYLGKTNA